MEVFEPIKGIEIIDLALYLKGSQVLIISDLHIGYEEALNKQGIFVPKFHFKDLVRRLESLFGFLDQSGRAVDTVLINGDLKHEFGSISDEEWRNTLKLLDYLRRHSRRIVLVRGNHDRILGPVAGKRDTLLVDDFIVGDVFICHGDTMPEIPPAIKTIIIGHEHPAVSLSEGLRTETFKAFLVGKHLRKSLVVQPSFNQMVEGTDVLREDLLSPFLQKDLGNFDVYLVADSVYHFGKLKKLEPVRSRKN